MPALKMSSATGTRAGWATQVPSWPSLTSRCLSALTYRLHAQIRNQYGLMRKRAGWAIQLLNGRPSPPTACLSSPAVEFHLHSAADRAAAGSAAIENAMVPLITLRIYCKKGLQPHNIHQLLKL